MPPARITLLLAVFTILTIHAAGREYHVSINGDDAGSGTRDPNERTVEINVREAVFYPEKTGINYLTHCEQAGIVGSMGDAFSTITGNVIHDINLRGMFGGAEMAGIKFHGAIDSLIKDNHVHRCGGFGGLWLDWMTQGTRVTGNLMHDNWNQDIFVELNHGPFVIDNNIHLSPVALLDQSTGGAYVHNLIQPFHPWTTLISPVA